jgi:hypothetical protein
MQSCRTKPRLKKLVRSFIPDNNWSYTHVFHKVYFLTESLHGKQLNIWIRKLTGHTLLFFRRLEGKRQQADRTKPPSGWSPDLSTFFKFNHGNCSLYIAITHRLGRGNVCRLSIEIVQIINWKCYLWCTCQRALTVDLTYCEHWVTVSSKLNYKHWLGSALLCISVP